MEPYLQAAVKQIENGWRSASVRDRREHLAGLNRLEVVAAAEQESDPEALALIEDIRALRQKIRMSLDPWR